ncbi:hypothetical protein T440DRAFT_466998 [Plenodomus tracheiphilus IPT5]|uniref:F-box domain-containing protein n=1 Tax=Plenodomus tracheiphilus IPT5 TaxID=1408161 RepID=A0A6A7BAC6_9PLEO|nr:hypothetical protein T440DRAFT_466998 [Plenodomus tracheiphilus IPT5]
MENSDTKALDAEEAVVQDQPAPTADAPQPTLPFRFMDLPTELRLMVYAQLPRSVKHTMVSQAGLPNVKVILITRHVPAAILCTCRTVYQEANEIVQNMVNEHVLKATPRMIKSKFGRNLVHKMLDEIGDEAQFFLAFPRSVGYYLEDTRVRIGHPRYCVVDDSKMSNVFRFIHQAVRISTNNPNRSMNWHQPLELVDSVGYNRGPGNLHVGFVGGAKMRNYDLMESLPVTDAGFLDQEDEFVLSNDIVPELWFRYPSPYTIPAMSVEEWTREWLPN